MKAFLKKNPPPLLRRAEAAVRRDRFNRAHHVWLYLPL